MSDENPVPPVVPPVLEPDPVPPPPSPAPGPVIETAAQQAVDRAEAAATRRRWVTLAELVGVAGLLIAALSLWMSWSDRRADEQEKRSEKASESKARTLVLLTGTPDGKTRLALKDNAHPIQSIDVRFPAALGVSNQSSVLEPHIDADWFSGAILAATDGGPDAREGRLPVLITSSYWDADTQRTDSAIYDVIWETHGRWPRSRALRVKGMILRERTSQPARLEALWAREKPKPAS